MKKKTIKTLRKNEKNPEFVIHMQYVQYNIDDTSAYRRMHDLKKTQGYG